MYKNKTEIIYFYYNYIYIYKNIIAVLVGSITLITVYLAQYVFGILPCHLCLIERYPYWVIIFVSCISFFCTTTSFMKKLFTSIYSMLFVLSFFLATYHIGIEHRLWEGPAGCSSNSSTQATLLFLQNSMNLSKLKDLNIQLVPCDKISWTFLGVSMSTMNAALSLFSAALFIHIFIQECKKS